MSEAVAPEYVAARRVLLDALESLGPHIDALVLVGAQAVYFHAPRGDARPSYTTDADLAIDPALLGQEPELSVALEEAGFVAGANPGHWLSPERIAVDLMVPEGSLESGTGRSAGLPGHEKRTARRTRGLELALLDYAAHPLTALDAADDRSITLKIAEPSALVVAKAVKLQERIDGGKPDRVLPKDAGDLLRLLRNADPRAMGRRLAELRELPAVSGQIGEVIEWLTVQFASARSPLVALAVLAQEPVEPADRVSSSLRTLGGRMLDAYAAGPA